jgi:hypothetical protein
MDDERRGEGFEAPRPLPGIPCPRHIKFEGPGASSLGAYGDNPVLLEAIKREIYAEWDRLRAQALARMETRVQALSDTVASFLAPAAPTPADDTAREGKPDV